MYELRNLELVCVARVSDQHKYCCLKEKKKKNSTYKNHRYSASLMGLQAMYYYSKLSFSHI